MRISLSSVPLRLPLRFLLFPVRNKVDRCHRGDGDESAGCVLVLQRHRLFLPLPDTEKQKQFLHLVLCFWSSFSLSPI